MKARGVGGVLSYMAAGALAWAAAFAIGYGWTAVVCARGAAGLRLGGFALLPEIGRAHV